MGKALQPPFLPDASAMSNAITSGRAKLRLEIVQCVTSFGIAGWLATLNDVPVWWRIGLVLCAALFAAGGVDAVWRLRRRRNAGVGP